MWLKFIWIWVWTKAYIWWWEQPSDCWEADRHTQSWRDTYNHSEPKGRKLLHLSFTLFFHSSLSFHSPSVTFSLFFPLFSHPLTHLSLPLPLSAFLIFALLLPSPPTVDPGVWCWGAEWHHTIGREVIVMETVSMWKGVLSPLCLDLRTKCLLEKECGELWLGWFWGVDRRAGGEGEAEGW